jgi:acyl-CoA thioesterase-2
VTSVTFHEQYLSPSDPGYDPLADLLRVLDLTPAAEVSPAAAGAAAEGSHGLPYAAQDVFLGASQPTPHGRVFGGQVVAQALIAAGLTVLAERRVHSLHGYFLRPGDATEPIRFEVERLRDGHSFSARRVHAVQHGQPILSMIFSFQVPAEGLDHQAAMPPVPMPDHIASIADLLAQAPDNLAKNWTVRRPIDMRHCEGPLYLRPGSIRTTAQHVWIRAVGRLPNDPLIHAAVLAYASDYTILEAVLREHGVYWTDPRLRPASLDHAMWFHRELRADEWILYAETSPSASGGRGLGFGHMFDTSGALVATVAQEGMLRIKERPPTDA